MTFIVVTLLLLLVSTLCLWGRMKWRSGEDVDLRIFSGFLKAGGLIAAPLTAVWVGYNSWIIVEPGHVQVARIFGSMTEAEWGEGFHWVNPLYDFDDYTVQRGMLDFSGEETLAGPAKGGVALEVFDVAVPYKLNTGAVWKLRQKVGTDYSRLLVSAARSAGRDTLANFTWEEAAYGDRAKLALFFQSRFTEILTADLQQAGFSDSESGAMFTILPVQVRNVRPPERILQANAEKAAAEVDLQRQAVLTEIAEQEALRRKQEGTGVQKLFAELPDASAEEINLVLSAISNKVRADALMRAVEEGKVTVMVLQGQEAAIQTAK